MKRKTFLRNTALAAAGSMVMPYILPSGRLFAATGSRKVNHVMFCLFAGGVRNLESVQKADGNLMPNTLIGTESISGDIIGGMSSLPVPVSNRLQTQGTLFKRFKYASGPTGHYNGHITAITGNYSDEAIKLKEPPKYPTIFEYYRKHNSPSTSALNAWWISDSLGPYPYLNYSAYEGYGPLYGANAIQPISLLANSNAILNNPLTISSSEKAKCDLMREFANGQFKAPPAVLSNSIKNNPEDAANLDEYLRQLMYETSTGMHTNQWGAGMNGDSYNLYFASKIIEKYKPELTVVNMQGVDVAHFEFTKYADNMRKADYALARLWQTIQSTPGMANDTVLIVAPEHGRNLQPNSVIDTYGRYALDHTNDEMSREIFCLIAGPSSVVKQNQVFSEVRGESVDIVPTIAHLLGFKTEIPTGMIQGRILNEALA